jgi:E3 ubiquitin-protein ligase HUWE1
VFFLQEKKLLLWILHFTTLLIEHSFSRHLYNSLEHLLVLLESNDMSVVLGVLNLLYMFSKRSNFISRLSPEKKNSLLSRLHHLAEVYVCVLFFVFFLCKKINIVDKHFL